jgi:hypothetical protein
VLDQCRFVQIRRAAECELPERLAEEVLCVRWARIADVKDVDCGNRGRVIEVQAQRDLLNLSDTLSSRGAKYQLRDDDERGPRPGPARTLRAFGELG